MRTKPADWRGNGRFEREPLRQLVAQRHPVEAFVIVEAGTVGAGKNRTLKMLEIARPETSPVFAQRVRARSRVIADASPTRHTSSGLLQEQRYAGLDRYADQQRAGRSKRPPHLIDHDVKRRDMLEHLHADDSVVASVFTTGVQRGDEIEVKTGAPAEASPAAFHLLHVYFDTDRFGRSGGTRHQERQERSIPAAVIENPLTLEACGELKSGFEAPAVAPRDQVVFAEDLLRRVVTVPESRIDRGRQYFRSRASHVPRKVIQKDTRIRRTSSRID